MRPNTIEQEYIKPFIEDNLAEVISKDFCKIFNDFISTKYPWHEINVYRIDWEEIGNYQRLNWIESSIGEDISFLRKTCIHSFSEVAIVYGAREPGLLISFDLVCKNLETLSAHTPLTFFMVGVKRNSYGLIELEHNCFVEMDMTKRWLTAPINNKTLLS